MTGFRQGIKKILCKLVLLAIPLYILMGLAAATPMSYMPIEYSMWSEEKDFVTTKMTGAVKNTDPKIVVIGDSRAKSGVLPKLLDSDGGVYNIAIGGCNSIEMYYALEDYLKKHKKPEKAIVIFAPYHFCDIDNWGQTQTFNYLSTDRLLSVYVEALKSRETGLLGEHFFTDVFSYKLRLPNKYLSYIYTARVNGRLGENRDKYDSVRADLGYTEFGSEKGNDKANYETHHEVFDLSPLVNLYYQRLLTLADENGIEVYVLQAPVNETSDGLITDEFRQGFAELMHEVKNAHPSFVVEDEIPVYENRYFGDNNHLNRGGAEKFTAEIGNRYF